jgi:hypothetical protein
VKIRLDWQKRALILFAVLILALSVVLTGLAIREAEREKLLAQREITEEVQKTADLIFKQIKDRIAQVEARILKLFKQSEFRADQGPSAQLAGQIQKSEPLVSEIFYLAEDGQVSFPLNKPLYRLSEKGGLAGQLPEEIAGHRLFKAAETAEFQNQNFALARQYYRELMASAVDKSSRALLLNAMARCYVNSGHPLQALETYEQLISGYSQEAGPDGLPLVLIALYQIGALHSDRNNEPDSAHKFLDLYAALLEPKWDLSRVQFDFYLSRVKKELNVVAAKMNDAESKKALAERQSALQQLESAKRKRMNAIEGILNSVIPIITTRNTDSVTGSENFAHVSGTAKGVGQLVSYMSPGDKAIFGFTLDDEYLKNGHISSIMEIIPLREG